MSPVKKPGPPPLTVGQNAGLGCLFGLGQMLVFLPWTFAIRHVLGKPESSRFDVVMIGILVLLLAIAAFSWNRANRWATLRTLPVNLRPPPTNSDPWFEQARRSTRLAAALLVYGLAAYFLTMIGLLASIDLARHCTWPSHDLMPTILYGLLGLWFVVAWAQGAWLFDRFVRRWPSNGDSEGADRLWDRELDHEYGTNQRLAP